MNIAIIKQYAISAVNAKIAEVVAVANEKFGTNFEIGKNLTIDLTLRGKCGGQACMEGTFGIRRYKMRINVGLMMINEENWWHVLDETITHEMAHLVDYMTRDTSDHGPIWKKIHSAFGGNAKRCHNMTTKRTGQRYVIEGKEICVKKQYHELIQGGYTGLTVTINGKRIVIEKKHHVGDFTVGQLDYVPTREGEPAPTVVIPASERISAPATAPKKAVAANTGTTGKYVAPSGTTVGHKPSKLGAQIWADGFTTQDAFVAEYEARGGKSAYSAFRSCARWYN